MNMIVICNITNITYAIQLPTTAVSGLATTKAHWSDYLATITILLWTRLHMLQMCRYKHKRWWAERGYNSLINISYIILTLVPFINYYKHVHSMIVYSYVGYSMQESCMMVITRILTKSKLDKITFSRWPCLVPRKMAVYLLTGIAVIAANGAES